MQESGDVGGRSARTVIEGPIATVHGGRRALDHGRLAPPADPPYPLAVVRGRWTSAVPLIGLVAGCGASPAQPPVAAGSSGSRAAPSGTITVFAASSLTGTFTALADAFEAAHPGVRIRLNFAGSSGLAQSIRNGAPADIFAAASDATMATVTGHGDAAGATFRLARNELQIATAPGNPRHIAGLADAVRPDVKLALCAPQVPCGAAAGKALSAAGLRASPVTLESDVAAVLTKVRLGEVDAGLVYRTDVLAAAGRVGGVSFPQAAQAVTNYPVVALRGSANRPLTGAFLRYLQSPAAAALFHRAGFLPP